MKAKSSFVGERKPKTRKRKATSPSSPAKSRPTLAPPAAGVPYRRVPAFVVIFEEPDVRNTGILAKTLRVREVQALQSRAGRIQFAPRAAGQPASQMFERLGVAVADLDPDEYSRLKQNTRVQEIVRNEIRRMPEPWFEALDPGFTPVPSVRQFDAMARALAPSTVGDALSAYLRGFHDGVGALLAALGGSVTCPAPSILAAAPTGLDWHLSSVRVGQPPPSGSTIKVAVLDTGISSSHPDFRGVFQDGINAASFVPGETIDDLHGHGTHCAGLVAGPLTSVGKVRYGVAPDVELLIGKVLSNLDGTGSDDRILDAIDWAVDRGARIISLSLGSRRAINQPFSLLYEKVASALLNQSPGVLIVAAAGNGSRRQYGQRSPVENPAACPSIMAVAAVDAHHHIADFSCATLDNVGRVDISAPGVGVYSSSVAQPYRLDSGTSIAAPIVAGVAALLAERVPAMSASDLWAWLLRSTKSLGSLADFGAGLVQMEPQDVSSPPNARRRAGPHSRRGATGDLGI